MAPRWAAAARRLLHDPGADARTLTHTLRAAFAAVYLLQVAGAILVGAVVVIAFGPQRAASGPMAIALVAVAALQVAIGLAVARAGERATRSAAQTAQEARQTGAATADETASETAASETASEAAREAERRLRTVRSGALAQTLLAAVLFATPLWFAAFALATGQTLLTLALLAVLASAGYGAGFLAAARLARAAADA